MANQDVRLTQPMLKVLRFLLETPREGRSGAEISRATRVGSGTLYPMLARLENADWLTSEWEAVNPAEVGRPRKRFYKLTALGQRSATAALAELQIRTLGSLAWNT
jgi:PadR family transcriptional regulator PadR